MAFRDKIDVDAFHSGIQYELEKLQFGFERTAVSNLKAKDTRALGTRLLINPELRVLVLTRKHVGSGEEFVSIRCFQDRSRLCKFTTRPKKRKYRMPHRNFDQITQVFRLSSSLDSTYFNTGGAL